MSRDQDVVALVGRLIAARKRRRISQRTLAQLMDVSQQALSAWETSTIQPSRRSLRTWAIALHETPPPERPAVRAKCGSSAGYEYHKAHEEPQCDPCTDAHAGYMREYRANRRLRQVAS